VGRHHRPGRRQRRQPGRYHLGRGRCRELARLLLDAADSENTEGGPAYENRLEGAKLWYARELNYIAEEWPGGDWAPATRGGPVEKIRVFPPLADRFVEIPSQIRNQIKEVSDSVYAVSIEFTDAAGTGGNVIHAALSFPEPDAGRSVTGRCACQESLVTRWPGFRILQGSCGARGPGM
jgi:hypothetical protein